MSKHLPAGAQPGRLGGGAATMPSAATSRPGQPSRTDPSHGSALEAPAAEPSPGPAEGLPLSMGEGGGAEVDEREAPRVLASGPTISYPLPAGLDLSQLTVVLTGGTSGLGLEAAKVGGEGMTRGWSLAMAGMAYSKSACPPPAPARAQGPPPTYPGSRHADAVCQGCPRAAAGGQHGQGAAVRAARGAWPEQHLLLGGHVWWGPGMPSPGWMAQQDP